MVQPVQELHHSCSFHTGSVFSARTALHNPGALAVRRSGGSCRHLSFIHLQCRCRVFCTYHRSHHDSAASGSVCCYAEGVSLGVARQQRVQAQVWPRECISCIYSCVYVHYNVYATR